MGFTSEMPDFLVFFDFLWFSGHFLIYFFFVLGDLVWVLSDFISLLAGKKNARFCQKMPGFTGKYPVFARFFYLLIQIGFLFTLNEVNKLLCIMIVFECF